MKEKNNLLQCNINGTMQYDEHGLEFSLSVEENNEFIDICVLYITSNVLLCKLTKFL